MNVATVGKLRADGRLGAPALFRAASFRRIASLGATVALVGVVSAPGSALGQPSPDPHPDKAPTPSTSTSAPDPAPDPAPAVSTNTSPPAPEFQPPPASGPGSPTRRRIAARDADSEAGRAAAEGTASFEPSAGASQRRSWPSRPRVQLASTPASQRPTLALSLLEPAEETERPLLLALLALLALALAVGSLLHLVSQVTPWRKA